MSTSVQKTGLDVVWELRLAEVAKNLANHGFAVDVLPSMAAALNLFAQTLLPEINPASATPGGSMTVARGGVYEVLKNWPGIEFINPYEPGITFEENMARRRRGLVSDLMVASSNAVLRDGRLLNLDGSGNRVAALHFGPRKVVLFVGRNKIAEDVESARQRIKEFAAPANCVRLSRKTPCVKTGSCMDCASPERICSVWTLTERSWPQGRIHVLLINEDLGF